MTTPKAQYHPLLYTPPANIAEQAEWNDTVYWFTQVVPDWTTNKMNEQIAALRKIWKATQ